MTCFPSTLRHGLCLKPVDCSFETVGSSVAVCFTFGRDSLMIMVPRENQSWSGRGFFDRPLDNRR